MNIGGIAIGLFIVISGVGFATVPLYTVANHREIVDTIPKILLNDGYSEYANIINQYISVINEGVTDADFFLNSREHFMNPHTQLGLGGFRSAGELGQEEFAKAVNYWLDGNMYDSMYHLGFVLHLVQDLTVPHHAVPTILDGHFEYENWLEKNTEQYLTGSSGIYDFDSLTDYLIYNGEQSLQMFEYVDMSGDDDYGFCASEMIPLAQSSSAGVTVLFFEAIEQKQPIIYDSGFDSGTMGLCLIFVGFVIMGISYRFI